MPPSGGPLRCSHRTGASSGQTMFRGFNSHGGSTASAGDLSRRCGSFLPQHRSADHAAYVKRGNIPLAAGAALTLATFEAIGSWIGGAELGSTPTVGLTGCPSRGTDAYLAGVAGRLSREAHLPASQFLGYWEGTLTDRIRYSYEFVGGSLDGVRGMGHGQVGLHVLPLTRVAPNGDQYRRDWLGVDERGVHRFKYVFHGKAAAW